jgi:hypothetical protein
MPTRWQSDDPPGLSPVTTVFGFSRKQSSSQARERIRGSRPMDDANTNEAWPAADHAIISRFAMQPPSLSSRASEETPQTRRTVSHSRKVVWERLLIHKRAARPPNALGFTLWSLAAPDFQDRAIGLPS